MADRLPTKAPNVTPISLYNLGKLFYGQERYDEAEEHLLRAFSMYKRANGLAHPSTQGVIMLLYNVYNGLGKPEKAAEYEGMLVEKPPK